MTGDPADLPWMDRYRAIIASMLPGEFPHDPPPHQRIAGRLTKGKANSMPGAISAANGLSVVQSVWSEIGRLDRDCGPILDPFKALTAIQAPDGHLLPTTADDHPESVWYFELQLAHALATAGLLQKDAELLSAARRAASFALQEIQPDHTTNRPWGITAFLLHQETLPLADWVLHAATVHLTSGEDEMTLLLLADCLYCFAP